MPDLPSIPQLDGCNDTPEKETPRGNKQSPSRNVGRYNPLPVQITTTSNGNQAKKNNPSEPFVPMQVNRLRRS